MYTATFTDIFRISAGSAHFPNFVFGQQIYEISVPHSNSGAASWKPGSLAGEVWQLDPEWLAVWYLDPGVAVWLADSQI